MKQEERYFVDFVIVFCGNEFSSANNAQTVGDAVQILQCFLKIAGTLIVMYVNAVE